MKIVTWNINGYRSAEKTHGLQNLIEKENPDIICLQEIKMNEPTPCEFGYHCYYNFAEKRGYSGVMIFTKEKPLRVTTELGLDQFDTEGRLLILEFEHFIVIDIYIPHGGRKKENHPYKFATLNKLIELLNTLKKETIICTDFNIAHTEQDLKNYKTNYNNNMFSRPEREKIDELLHIGFVDTFRVLHNESDVYSMWPNGFDARKRNMGWRIDYIFASATLTKNIKRVEYLKEIEGSDHCPCILELI